MRASVAMHAKGKILKAVLVWKGRFNVQRPKFLMCNPAVNAHFMT